MPLYRAELLAKKPLWYGALIHDVSQVLYLPFDYDDGIRVRDRSGYNNHGTIYGAARVGGKIGMALSFDGVDDYVEVPDDPSLDLGSEDFTMLGWIKTSADITTRQSLFGKKYDIYSHQPGYFLFVAGGKIEARVSDGTNQVVPTQTALANAWQHVALVRSGNTFTVYVDATAGTPVTLTIGNTDNDWDFRCGRVRVGFYPFNGVIDEVRIYNRALSQDEIHMLMYRRL